MFEWNSHNLTALVDHRTAGLQVSLKREHGLDARPGAQERVAYRRKKEKSFVMWMKSSLTGLLHVYLCVCVHAYVGVTEIKRPYHGHLVRVCWWW